MLKTSKLSHKSHKSSKESALRKSHVSKKVMRSRSPVRHRGGSRPPPMKHMSPGMKRGHLIPKRKTSRSPRMRSIASSPRRSLSHRSKSPVSMERARPMKSLKYEKRKRMSNSPVRHMGSSAPRRPVSPRGREMSPYLSDRYQDNPIPHSQQYSPPVRKKMLSRSVSPSPPHRHAPGPAHIDGHISRRVENSSPVLHQKHRRNIPLGHVEREKHGYDIRNKPDSPPVMSSSRSKDVALKVPYPGESSRYRSPSPGNRYPPSGSKMYGPTLHERFSSVIESNRTEPRVRYSREDLEKITIDIRRNVRDPSPPIHHAVNPANVKLVRRPNEGHRPIFDREELKQASRIPREEVFFEHKASSYGSPHPVDMRNVENYQITRHHDVYQPNSTRPVSDRWPSHEGRKETMILDRDEREKDYARFPVSRSHVVPESRSRSRDRDFRSERYLDVKPSTTRIEYSSRPPGPPIDSSPSYPHHKGSLPPDARHKLNYRKGDRDSHLSSVRSESKGHYLPPDHYPDPMPPRGDRREHHSSVPEPHKWDYRSRSPSREKLPDYPPRPDKYGYKPWPDKSDISPPRGSGYYENDGREGSGSFRGSTRPFRSSRGFRSRGFRGPLRGSSYRGSFRGGYSPRGRGIPRR